jgi:hypothetical protein
MLLQVAGALEAHRDVRGRFRYREIVGHAVSIVAFAPFVTCRLPPFPLFEVSVVFCMVEFPFGAGVWAGGPRQALHNFRDGHV